MNNNTNNNNNSNKIQINNITKNNFKNIGFTDRIIRGFIGLYNYMKLEHYYQHV